MRYWDTSALVPLLAEEPASARCERLLHDDPDIVVWSATIVECGTALSRRRREGTLDPVGGEAARTVLVRLAESWREIAPSHRVRDAAMRLTRVHPLHAPDALQLAAALVWRGDDGAGGAFVTDDRRLATAVGLEGFRVVPVSEP